MGKGGGFSSADPLGRMLADKRSAADARAQIIARMRRSEAAPEEEKSTPSGEVANGASSHWMRPFRAHLLSGASTGIDVQTMEASLQEAVGQHARPRPALSPPWMSPIAPIMTPIPDEANARHGDLHLETALPKLPAAAADIGRSDPIDEPTPTREDAPQPTGADVAGPASNGGPQHDQMVHADVSADAASEVSQRSGDDETTSGTHDAGSDPGRCPTTEGADVVAGAEPAPATTRAAPLETPLTQIICASVLTKSAAPSLWAACLGDLTLCDYAADRSAVAKRLATIPAFLVPESVTADILDALDKALTQTASEPPAPQPTKPDDVAPPPAAQDETAPAAQSNSHSSATRFPEAATNTIDVARAEAALDVLSKRGFERFGAWREVGDAIRYLRSVGYTGSASEAYDDLRMLLESRGETAPAPDRATDAREDPDPLAPETTSRVGDDGEDATGQQQALATKESDSVLDRADATPSDDDLRPAPTMADILEAADVSTRLSNIRIVNEQFFREWTADEAMRRRQEFFAEVLTLNNAGRVTIGEIDRILDQFADGRLVLPSADAEAADDDGNAISESALEEPIAKVLGMHPISTRLEGALTSDRARSLRLRDFVEDREGFIRTLQSLNNTGRKTIDEACGILSARVDAIRKWTDGDRDDDDGGPENGNEGPQAKAGAARIAPREGLRNAIAALPAKEAQVLRWRYGLDGETIHTLQEIADSVHVTRERVRQVEQKGLRRLTKGAARFALAAFVAAEQPGQWKALAGGEFNVPFDRLHERKRALDPLFVLAVDAQIGGLREWLDVFAVQVADGWTRDALDAERRESLKTRIEATASTFPLPLPLEFVLREAGEDVDTQVVESLGLADLTVFEGYLCSGHLGVRAQRKVRLHLVARMIAQSGLFDIGTLIRAYRELVPEDDAGSRLILMQMEEAPHLFVSVFDGVWLALPPPIDDLHLDAPPFEQSAVIKQGEFTGDSTGAAIWRTLAANGPARQSELVSSIVDETGVARTSVSPTLLMNPCFRRVAPGFFSLYGGQHELSENLRTSLLDEAHCRTFCLLRHCGAPADYFPAWGPEFEMALTQWAHSNAPTDLYRSLVSVIEPNHWPIPPELAVQVERIKQSESRWSIGSERKDPLGQRFMEPRQFLAILAHLAVFGWIGWCAVNRITGAPLATRDAADVLAFLVLAGLAEPRDDWQGPHAATPLATSLFRSTADLMYRTGQIDWAHEALAPILDGITAPSGPLGWVEPDEARAAIEAWRSGELSIGRAFARGPAAPIDIEETFNSAEWESIFGAEA